MVLAQMRAAVDLGHDEIDMLLDDSELLNSEFAAIMIASGFGDRLIAGTLARDPANRLLGLISGPTHDTVTAPVFRRNDSLSRVRSPPEQ